MQTYSAVKMRFAISKHPRFAKNISNRLKQEILAMKEKYIDDQNKNRLRLFSYTSYEVEVIWRSRTGCVIAGKKEN